MAWKMKNVQEQRMAFVVAASRKEKPVTQLCAEFGISRPTGYCWLKRYQAQGIGGVAELSRRPHLSPRRTAAEQEERVVELRQERPDWGARKIQHLLQGEGIKLPRSTVHRIFLRHQLVREQDRRQLAMQRFAREKPNELWQMDFKGPKGWDQPVGPLSLLDDHSRYALGLENVGSTQIQGVQSTLERIFSDCGLPDEMLMDHGTPWFNAQGTRGWSRLTVWLMDQDIQLCFSGVRHPQTQGKVERFHRSLTAALLRRGVPEGKQRQAWLDAFREEYNQVRPHEALQMKTPQQIWHKSLRPYRTQLSLWQYPAGSEVKELDKMGQMRMEGRRYCITKALAGMSVGLVPVHQRILVYYRRTLLCELDPLQARSIPAGTASSHGGRV